MYILHPPIFISISLHHVASRRVDKYAPIIGRWPEVDALFVSIKGKVGTEVLVQEQLAAVQGMMGTLRYVMSCHVCVCMREVGMRGCQTCARLCHKQN